MRKDIYFKKIAILFKIYNEEVNVNGGNKLKFYIFRNVVTRHMNIIKGDIILTIFLCGGEILAIF